jgi:hypothetical protein
MKPQWGKNFTLLYVTEMYEIVMFSFVWAQEDQDEKLWKKWSTCGEKDCSIKKR